MRLQPITLYFGFFLRSSPVRISAIHNNNTQSVFCKKNVSNVAIGMKKHKIKIADEHTIFNLIFILSMIFIFVVLKNKCNFH